MTETKSEEKKAAWKPPPGSWKCPSCSNVNYPTRAFCNRCQLPLSTSLLAPVGWLAVPNPPATTKFRPPLGSWRCPLEECKNINFPHRPECNRCQTPKPTVEESAVKTPPAAKLKPGCWLCPRDACGNVNFPFRDVCNRCNTLKPATVECPLSLSLAGLQLSPSMPPSLTLAMQAAMLGLSPFDFMAPVPGKRWTPPPGSWRCPDPACKNINFASRKACNRCSAAKPSSISSATATSSTAFP